MSVLISMQVSGVSWDKLRGAVDWAAAQPRPGHLATRVYRAEDDGSTVLVLEEWDDHQSFHAFAEQCGDEFNRRAGTQSAPWIDRTWVLG